MTNQGTFGYTVANSPQIRTGAFQANLQPNLSTAKAFQSLSNLVTKSIKAYGEMEEDDQKKLYRERKLSMDNDLHDAMSKTADLDEQYKLLTAYQLEVDELLPQFTNSDVKLMASEGFSSTFNGYNSIYNKNVVKKNIEDLGTDFNVAVLAAGGNQEELNKLFTEFKGAYKHLEGDNKKRGTQMLVSMANTLINQSIKNSDNPTAELADLRAVIRGMNTKHEDGKATGDDNYEKLIGSINSVINQRVSLATEARNFQEFQEANALVEDEVTRKLNAEKFMRLHSSKGSISKAQADLIYKTKGIKDLTLLGAQRDPKTGERIDEKAITLVGKEYKADTINALVRNDFEYVGEMADKNFKIAKEASTYMFDSTLTDYMNIHDNKELRKQDADTYIQQKAFFEAKMDQMINLNAKYPGILDHKTIATFNAMKAFQSLPMPVDGKEASLADKVMKYKSLLAGNLTVNYTLENKEIKKAFEAVPIDERTKALRMYNALMTVTGDEKASMEATLNTHTFTELGGDSDRLISSTAYNAFITNDKQAPYFLESVKRSFPTDTPQYKALSLMDDTTVKITLERGELIFRDDAGSIVRVPNLGNRFKAISDMLMNITAVEEEPGITMNLLEATGTVVGEGGKSMYQSEIGWWAEPIGAKIGEGYDVVAPKVKSAVDTVGNVINSVYDELHEWSKEINRDKPKEK